MKAIRLRTEYLKDPLGIAKKHPRLMWNCEAETDEAGPAAAGKQQTAYRIVTERWDSGKVLSSAMHAEYPLGLHARERVTWKICLWDENDEPGEWSEAFFECGISSWDAEWITGNYTVNKKERCPVDCFRKAFKTDRLVQKARLYITACGLYEARLNGKKAGDFCLAPGHTDYRKRIQYQTYDVTEMLQTGENELTVQLADGWYRGSCGAWGLRNQYGTETKLLAQLEIGFEDGSKQTIITDDSWQWSDDGPIREADNTDGEIVEAFRTPLYMGKAKVTKHPIKPTASNNVPVTEHEHFHPVISEAPNGKLLLDFGQNIAGYVSFRMNAHLGQRMIWRFGEMLDEEGNLTQKNIQLSGKKKTTPLQRIDYTCGEGWNDYKTTFAVFGFRYAEVETELELSAEDIEAIAVYSDIEQTGYFTSSNELLNKFFNATVWSTKGNHLDVPTDCPTRERHGWTGDAQIFFNTAAYLFDFAAFSRKYMKDVFDWQKKDGKLPQIAPCGGVDFYMKYMDGSVGWSDVGILIPYRYWKIYQDDSLIRAHYKGMVKYARFMISRCTKWTPLSDPTHVHGEARKFTVNYGQSYGEWAEPADVFPNHWTNVVKPHPEESTAYTAYMMRLMAEIAGHMGKPQDQAIFLRYEQGCTEAYRALIKHPAYTLDTDRQAKLVRPLYMRLLDDEAASYARERLLQALEHYGYRLGTGFLSTPFILDVLTEIDPEAAYRLLENEEMPGWLFMAKSGATTIWESWEGTEAQGGIASLNHYSKGALCEWLFKTMCGIRVDGENHFTIAPVPGGHFTYAKASYNSVFGQVMSRWERTEEGYSLTVSIPANTEAEVILPNGQKISVYAGVYHFSWETKKRDC